MSGRHTETRMKGPELVLFPSGCSSHDRPDPALYRHHSVSDGLSVTLQATLLNADGVTYASVIAIALSTRPYGCCMLQMTVRIASCLTNASVATA